MRREPVFVFDVGVLVFCLFLSFCVCLCVWIWLKWVRLSRFFATLYILTVNKSPHPSHRFSLHVHSSCFAFRSWRALRGQQLTYLPKTCIRKVWFRNWSGQRLHKLGLSLVYLTTSLSAWWSVSTSLSIEVDLSSAFIMTPVQTSVISHLSLLVCVPLILDCSSLLMSLYSDKSQVEITLSWMRWSD